MLLLRRQVIAIASPASTLNLKSPPTLQGGLAIVNDLLAFLNGQQGKMAAPRRRNCDPLGTRAHEERYAATSQHADCYLSGCKALRERTGQECLAAHLNAKTAAAASHVVRFRPPPGEFGLGPHPIGNGIVAGSTGGALHARGNPHG